MAKQELEQAIKELGLSIEATFVPFSQSRNKDEKTPSLNWLVALKRTGYTGIILTTDYMAGCAHCPSYKQGDRSLDHAEVVRWECENGKQVARFAVHHRVKQGSKPINPDTCDVIHSLVSDSDVLDYADFEEWADSFGYDADSRKAEKIYKACLAIAIKLRRALGEAALAKLREAAQDY